ncbi:MAG: PIN domain-containing protein [Candidatus Sulfotelmatobacter sp.]
MLVFVDTNVFIYYLDTTDSRKHEAARLWLAELWQKRLGRISFQVLQEFYSVGTQKWPALKSEIQSEIGELFDWHPVVINRKIIKDSWEVQARYKVSFWDSLIVSAAKVASCRYLLTEDLQEGQEMDGVVVVNPFRNSPNEIIKS